MAQQPQVEIIYEWDRSVDIPEQVEYIDEHLSPAQAFAADPVDWLRSALLLAGFGIVFVAVAALVVKLITAL